MNTDLTDAEWALVGDLFERDGQRGAPPRYERRRMVNACCYALRTGCAWRLLEPPRLSRRLIGLSHADMADSGDCE